MPTTQSIDVALDAVLNPLIALRAHAKHMTVIRSRPLDPNEPILTPDEVTRFLTEAGAYLDKIDPQDQQGLDDFARAFEVIKKQIVPSHKLNT
jgi:hypothetical protein